MENFQDDEDDTSRHDQSANKKSSLRGRARDYSRIQSAGGLRIEFNENADKNESHT